jgi:hypothetical protein
VLVVHGGPKTVVVRDRTGRPVVLLSGEPPETLGATELVGLLDLAAAVLTAREMACLADHLTALRQGAGAPIARLQLDGLSFALYVDDPDGNLRAVQRASTS